MQQATESSSPIVWATVWVDVVHGYGANLDGYQTQEPRRLVPGLAFTIEPGVYLPAFGVRSEIDLFMTEHGPESTTVVQREIVRIPVK